MNSCFSAVAANLEEWLASSAKATLQAIGAQEAAVQAITQHTYKLKAAMEAEVRPTAQGFPTCYESFLRVYVRFYMQEEDLNKRAKKYNSC